MFGTDLKDMPPSSGDLRGRLSCRALVKLWNTSNEARIQMPSDGFQGKPRNLQIIMSESDTQLSCAAACVCIYSLFPSSGLNALFWPFFFKFSPPQWRAVIARRNGRYKQLQLKASARSLQWTIVSFNSFKNMRFNVSEGTLFIPRYGAGVLSGVFFVCGR